MSQLHNEFSEVGAWHINTEKKNFVAITIILKSIIIIIILLFLKICSEEDGEAPQGCHRPAEEAKNKIKT